MIKCFSSPILFIQSSLLNYFLTAGSLTGPAVSRWAKNVVKLGQVTSSPGNTNHYINTLQLNKLMEVFNFSETNFMKMTWRFYSFCVEFCFGFTAMTCRDHNGNVNQLTRMQIS